jgi:ERCC4-type nuclease
MRVKVDIREQDLIQCCENLIKTIPSFKDLVLVRETLPLGDIIIGDDNSDRVIIERKSLRDLNASIKDGRYEEQSYRLNGISHHNHNIIYLIEGSMDKINIFRGHTDKMMLYSAMVSINYFKGFSVMRSFSLDESALMICNCAYKIAKGETEHKKAYYKYTALNHLTEVKDVKEESDTDSKEEVNESKSNSSESPAVDSDYCAVVKKVKKENVTPDNIGEIMLCQIPSISSVTAIAILAEYKTLPNLLTSIKNDATCLKNISYTTSTGQTRKISKACIENIIKYLAK